MTEQPLTKKTVDVLDSRMAYHERGEGGPVLLLHGNPTSSYLWRNVIPELAGRGRLIVPDLIGMGDSAKLPNPQPDTYRFTTHRKYLEGFIDAVVGRTESILFVVHDWGSALGFDWANHHRDRVRGIAYMEAIVRPIASWEEWSPQAVPIFQGFRSDKGETMILERNMFVERVLPGPGLRKLSEPTMAEDRRRLFAMDGREHHPKTVRQRRARRHPDRYVQGFLQELEQPDRGERIRLAFHPGGFRAGHRPGRRRLDEGQRAVETPIAAAPV